MGGCNFGKILPSLYQIVTEGKFMIFDDKLSNSLEVYYLEPGLCPSITDVFESMNNLIPEKQSQRKLYPNPSISKDAKNRDLPGI